MSYFRETSSNVWAVARWEATMVRRTVRYWIFGLLAVLVALAMANLHSAQNFFMSRFFAVSGTIGLINPKFLMSGYVMFLAVAVTLLTTFLTFDFRQKEKLARLDLVLGARPIRTGELVAGKVLGIFIPVYAMVGLALLALVVSNAIWGFGTHYGAIVTALLFQFPPAILEMIALTALIGVLVGNRAVTAILSLAAVLAMALNLFGVFGTRLIWVPVFDIFGASGMPFPSVMMGLTPMLQFANHRVGALALAIGLLGLVTLLYPRPRDVAFPKGALATTLVGIAIGGFFISLPVQDALDAVRLNKKVLAEQRELVDAPQIRVSHYDLNVRLDMPRGRLHGVARMHVENAGTKPADRLVFTLNRGLAVTQATRADESPVPYERGLSTIVLKPQAPLAPGASLDLTLEYGGAFDINDGFLDAPIQLLELDGGEMQVALLGFQNAYLTGRGAVLPPETRWYPAPNVDYGYGPQGRPANFATASIEIDVPNGMIPVTQGVPAEPNAHEGRTVTRFESRTAVPAFSLNVAPFRVIEGRVRGLPVAVYYHPAHESNILFLEDAAPRIQEELAKILERAEEAAGLSYPFERLALVECPVGLRSYGGGWEMPSPQAQPGIVMLKENQFFESRLESIYEWREKRMKDRDEDVEPIDLKWTLLDELFRYDYSGGNLLELLGSQFWRQRLRASGDLASAVDRALGMRAADSVTGRRNYFNPYLYAGGGFNQNIGNLVQGTAQGIGGQAPFDFTDSLIKTVSSDEDVWQLVESRPLAELEPAAEPADYLVATDLKMGAFLQALYAKLEDRGYAEMCREMTRRYAPGTFTLDQMQAVASEVHGGDLSAFFDLWLRSTRLPGYRIISSDAYRVQTDSGLPRYQARLRLQNGVDVAGTVWVALLVEKEEANARRWDSVGQFVSFDGRQEKELAMLVSRKPRRFVVHPFLSLNRAELSRDLEVSDQERDVEPIEGLQDVELTSEEPGVTIVDDMDDGFRVEGGTSRGALRIGGRQDDADQGVIPACRPATPSPTWCRQEIDRAYGRYRHVVTARPPGQGDGWAIWSGTIQSGGTCQVDVHVPVLAQGFAWRAMGFRTRPKGELEYSVQNAGGEDPVRLSVEGLTDGWNSLGEFQFEDGQTSEVRLANKSEGLVVADAVRWTCQP